MKSIKIGNKKVGPGNPAFIIAELSGNHLQNFDIAVKSIHAMKDAGADCVKLQTVKPGSITIDCDKTDFIIKGTIWEGRKLYDLYNEVYTPWEWHQPLIDLANKLGMVAFSSPFDHEAVDFLETLNVPAYKIASFEITDIPLIKHTASKGKPIIISTGIAEEEDIKDAYDACLSVGNNDVIFLKCTSAYPTPISEVNLSQIRTLQERFKCLIGLSDHTLGHVVPMGAVALGAVVIEKHFILDRNMGGADAKFSMEPHEFENMVKSVRQMELAIGKPEIVLSPNVAENKLFARSLYAVKDILAGETITSENVKSIRPGFGLKPKYYEQILGTKATKFIERGTPISFEQLQ